MDPAAVAAAEDKHDRLVAERLAEREQIDPEEEARVELIALCQQIERVASKHQHIAVRNGRRGFASEFLGLRSQANSIVLRLNKESHMVPVR